MTELTRPLSDVTVLELGHIVAGPFCSLQLADMGAQVIKIEHPEHGDAFRGGSTQAESTFNYVNRNKEGITVDLKDSDGREVFTDLVREADVLIENYSPGVVKRLGVDYETLSKINPSLVYCSIKGFNDGPYSERPALDPVAEALAGLMSTTGYPDHPPARCGASVADMTAALHGALAVVAALRQREHTGKGQHVSAPLFESTVSLMGGHLAYSDAQGEPVKPWGGGGQVQWAPYGVFRTGDERWVFIGPSSERHWQGVCEAFDLDLDEEERFRTLEDRRENRDELAGFLEDVLQTYTREEIVDRLTQEDVPVAPIKNTLETCDDPHLEATGGLVEIVKAESKNTTVRVPRSPIRSSTYESPEATDPPKQGADTTAVLRSIGYSSEQIDALQRSGAIGSD